PDWRQGQQFSAAGLFAVSRSRHRPAAGRRGVHVELAGPGASGFPTELDRPATELHGWRRPGRIPHLLRLHASLLIPRRARHSSASRPDSRSARLGLRRVGARGFEPPTSWSRTRRANRAALRPEARKLEADETEGKPRALASLSDA